MPLPEDTVPLSTSGGEDLKLQNILLKQELAFSRRFQEHVESVDKKLISGKWRLTLVGAAALALVWLGTYDRVKTAMEERIEARLDTEFSQPTIKAMIRDAAYQATQKVIRERMETFAATEAETRNCLINRLSQDLFQFQCYADGGSIDFARGNCLFTAGTERTFVPPYPQVDCNQVLSEVQNGGQ